MAFERPCIYSGYVPLLRRTHRVRLGRAPFRAWRTDALGAHRTHRRGHI